MLRTFCYSLFLAMLVACGSSPPAPIEDRQPSGATSSSSRYYTVQRGDTLYSIAFRYGLDFRVLAAANGIASPYTIYPGQKLDLEKQTPAVSTTKSTSAAKPAPKPAASPKPVATAKPTAKSSQSAGTAKTAPLVSKAPPAPVKSEGGTWTGASVKTWRWPASGRVTRGYSSSVHKGIDIAGKRGDPIVAVAAGKVVYAGTGIVGFGELLIVKHNDVYLSAYGHNDRLLVTEGQQVGVGQKIAEKGSSGTDTVKLHFEIRREGKPIDPMRILPKR
ncbi:MAG: peptidoglycan DD-metalloendopeptidase family protein [Halieaceae bacterium]